MNLSGVIEAGPSGPGAEYAADDKNNDEDLREKG